MSILVLTSDTLIGTPATGNLEYNGQFFGTDSNASRAQLQRITQGTAVASASGTSIDFTGLPAWVKRITVMYNGVSLNSGSVLRFRLGTGGTPTTSGYLGTTVNPAASPTSQSFTAGFDMYGALTAATAAYGAIVFTLIGSNAWACSGNIGTSLPGFNSIAGTVSLSSTLDFVRITTVNGTDTFDAGSINILYEG
jgi:hypothetical protein